MNSLTRLLFPELANFPATEASARLATARAATFRARPGLWAALLLGSAALGLLPLGLSWLIAPGVLQENTALRVLAVAITPVFGLLAWSLLCARAIRPALRHSTDIRPMGDQSATP